MTTVDKKAPRAIGNLLVTVIFASLGLIELLNRDFLGAGIWLGIATALAVMGPENRPWPEISPWRRVVGSALTVISLALFGYKIFKDFSG